MQRITVACARILPLTLVICGERPLQRQHVTWLGDAVITRDSTVMKGCMVTKVAWGFPTQASHIQTSM
jgi:hypothetical protein